jgi:hypothetical protein
MLGKNIMPPVIIYKLLYMLGKFLPLTTLSSLVLPRYFIAVQKCLGLYSDNGQYSADDVERLSALYESLKKDYAWSSAVKVNIFN